MDKNICNRLKMVRDNARVSRSGFAAAIGIGQSSYNEIETGKREPSDPIVIAISSRFKVSEAWLRGGVGDSRTAVQKAGRVLLLASGALDSKSVVREDVPVQVRPPGPSKKRPFKIKGPSVFTAEWSLRLRCYPSRKCRAESGRQRPAPVQWLTGYLLRAAPGRYLLL